jgi:plasmid stability protein
MAMAQFTVRNLEDDVKRRLQARAALHGVSMEEEVRRVLRQAVMTRQPPVAGLGSRMAGRFARQGLRDHESIAELQGQEVRVAAFDE